MGTSKKYTLQFIHRHEKQYNLSGNFTELFRITELMARPNSSVGNDFDAYILTINFDSVFIPCPPCMTVP